VLRSISSSSGKISRRSGYVGVFLLFAAHGRQHRGKLVGLGGLRERDGVHHQHVVIDRGDRGDHLGLVVDQHEGGVLGREQVVGLGIPAVGGCLIHRLIHQVAGDGQR
jgi:hypothetical protein